ncbi:horcolin-like [Zingiber officinale]|uniref:Jacalin-type lectin domain-containing protein n=1 Tax=Zingiber officinale TaxID=94328 RepID=A0A8J5HG08_ZINOF|nr:horcolin-like [Zingiber officinale]KAG6526778.1 hypothetical protein ZIOFF_016779 [Zingiber officinale]
MAEASLTSAVGVNELCKSSEQKIPLKVGPWGGSGDTSFDIIGPPTSQITKILVKTGAVVDSLVISYVVDWEVQSYRAGGTGGVETHEFELGGGEYINKIFGSISDYNGETCISQLGFKTNLGKQHGPFGKGCGKEFTVPVVNGRIVGLFGQYTNYINAIGVSALLLSSIS